MDYRLDKNYSYINWTGFQQDNSHFGTVKFKQGKARVSDGEIISGFAQVDLASLEVTDSKLSEEKRTELQEHLKSKDFFNVPDHPSAVFEINEVKRSSGSTTHTMEGDMNINGIKHHMSINANIVVTGEKLEVKAKFKLIRTQFGINFMIEESYGAQKVLPEFEVEMSLLAINTNH
jgi:polyisoprenoid-binding protein YceI